MVYSTILRVFFGGGGDASESAGNDAQKKADDAKGVVSKKQRFATDHYYEIISLDPLNTAPIIATDFNQTTAQQYETLLINFNVYDPLNMEAPVEIKVNGQTAASLTVDRTTQAFTYRVSESGSLVGPFFRVTA